MNIPARYGRQAGVRVFGFADIAAQAKERTIICLQSVNVVARFFEKCTPVKKAKRLQGAFTIVEKVYASFRFTIPAVVDHGQDTS
jgi:hypothetical protein